MAKNLKLFYILTFVISGIVMAWKSLSASLFGVGVNFVVMLVLLALMLMFICTDKEVKSRTIDLFIVSCVFTVLEFVLFLVIEIFNVGLGSKVLRGFNVYQSIVSFFGIIFFAYIVFRFITEVKGKKVAFVEAMLTGKREKKAKKAKELTNGSLMEKPAKHKELEETSNFSSIQQTEQVIQPTTPAASYELKNDENSER